MKNEGPTPPMKGGGFVVSMSKLSARTAADVQMPRLFDVS